MFNIIFLGAPGSGKGTQANILSQEISIPAISTGDILRFEVKNESEIGLLAKKYMDSGSLVPDEIVIGIIKKRILEKDCDNGFILDGFPRNINQAISLDANLNKINKSISSVVMIDVPDDAIVKRITGRFSCKNCATLYNKFFNNTKIEGVCDNCGATNFISRSDDNEEAIINRLRVYHDDTEKLIKFYEKKDLISKVNGLKHIDQVKKNIKDNVMLSINNVNNN